MTDNDSHQFYKGIITTMGIVVAIMTGWSVYTQSNRFTTEDGERHVKRFEKMEERDQLIIDSIEKHRAAFENKYDHMITTMHNIEGSLKYISYFAAKSREKYNNPNIIGKKFTEGERERVSP